VAGLGGLGHLAVKMSIGLGATTSVISRTPDKADEAHGMGAHGFVVSTDPKQMKAARDRLEAGAPVRDATCGMKPDGTPKSCPRSNGGNGGGNGGNEANSTVVCERGFELMTIDAMLRSVAAPGIARDLKAADVNRNDHLCVQLAADGRSMTRFVDNNWAV